MVLVAPTHTVPVAHAHWCIVVSQCEVPAHFAQVDPHALLFSVVHVELPPPLPQQMPPPQHAVRLPREQLVGLPHWHVPFAPHVHIPFVSALQFWPPQPQLAPLSTAHTPLPQSW